VRSSLCKFFSCYEPQQLTLGTGTAIWWVTEPHCFTIAGQHLLSFIIDNGIDGLYCGGLFIGSTLRVNLFLFLIGKIISFVHSSEGVN
jgi:hypothetical protein